MNVKTIALLIAATLVSCGNGNKKTTEKPVEQPIVTVTFNADSAYSYVEKQVAFGSRVPHSQAHADCAEYLLRKMAQFGAETTLQQGKVELYNGKVITAKNIISSFASENPNRILLCAHWDSRPFADQEKDPALQQTPIDGANDGASGVGVLMEIARTLSTQPAPVGIDFIFFDAEDYGVPEFDTSYLGKEDTWCLGAQYWSRNPHKLNYKAKYGILLDMVGDKNAVFMKDQVSAYFAPHVLDKVWNAAKALGYGKYFVDKTGGVVTDDHLYVNRLAKIPCIDIIHFDTDSEIGFADYWHTHRDDMRNISKETLKVVGETVSIVIFNEK